ncbi:hypothetical protein [Ruminococcus sp.]|uniref:hypothetical protein n=1 Tax=Ruminococcus sp. TaxID=41978 RepID=UPI0025E80685|nr:hypothetical protein [Ruminococcus sp.]MBQ9542452.1 hypothetical protein [Ruminococcus sp.]
MSEKKKLIPILISVCLTFFMVGVAELTGERELIFPEITAIAIGALAAPAQVWNTDRKRLFILIMSAAVTGMAIVRFIPLPTVLQIPIGLAAVMGLIIISHTSFMPAISACVLPIMLGTRSPYYLLSVGVMTALILLAQKLLEKAGLREKREFIPEKPDAALIKLRAVQAATASVLCAIPVLIGQPFFAAPPLIVAFCELTTPECKLTKRLPETAITIVIAAFMGCSSRLLLCEIFGLPMAVAAALTCCAMLFGAKSSGLYFPPCGAVATLPFLIAPEMLLKFPFEVTAGFLCFLLVILLSLRYPAKHGNVVHNS